MAAFLELTGVSKSFFGVRALRDVDFTVDEGEVHCLVGENGSGKSTLIKIIAGVEAPDAGSELRIGGQRFERLTPAESKRLGVQVIYQDLSLFPNLTVAENIAIGNYSGSPRLVDRKQVNAVARAAMARIDVSLDLGAKVADLSIASRQLVAICRAMAHDARLVIMDEPTSSLTRQEVDALIALVRDLKRKGIATMFVSHRLDEVMEVAERVTVLRDGQKIGTFSATEMDDKRLAYLMTGKEFAYELKEVQVNRLPVALSVSHLSREGEYEDISFDVHAGEILGITGLLGSGRTELALSLFGMTQPDSGAIAVSGETVRFAGVRDAVNHGIAYVPEDRLKQGLVLEQSIGANIILTVLEMIAGRLGLISPSTRRETIENWIRQLAIKVSDPDNPVKTLSGGNQQRVVIAKWMARKPRILILDSPTVGVDISAKDGIYEIVKRLAGDGMAVIMISDEIPEVLYHSHRILVMHGGRITGEYAPFRSSEAELTAAVNA
jgi:simple sugar transport system ATP-binding protein